jgi:fatty acid desaturase
VKAGLQPLESVLFVTHFALYAGFIFVLGERAGTSQAIIFVVIQQGLFGLFNASVFASNHKGMELLHSGDKRGFLLEQVLTSRNLHGHWWTDFWYGGLNYQIEHHLFPTMARNNLSRAQGLVRAVCEEEGIPYHATGVVTAYREMFVHLHRASASLRTA